MGFAFNGRKTVRADFIEYGYYVTESFLWDWLHKSYEDLIGLNHIVNSFNDLGFFWYYPLLFIRVFML